MTRVCGHMCCALVEERQSRYLKSTWFQYYTIYCGDAFENLTQEYSEALELSALQAILLPPSLDLRHSRASQNMGISWTTKRHSTRNHKCHLHCLKLAIVKSKVMQWCLLGNLRRIKRPLVSDLPWCFLPLRVSV